MNAKAIISALFDEEKGDVKCGYCGKKLLCLQKKSKKCQKNVDKQNNSAIIEVKCSRCGNENELLL